MTMKLPEKAGFVPTPEEWDQLVRIAENLAAQLAQAQASAVETARIVGAERDAARAEVARLTAALTEADKSAQEMADEFYEVSEGAYLIDPVQFDAHRQAIRAALRQPAPACSECNGTRRVETEEFGRIICPMCKDKPAPARGQE